MAVNQEEQDEAQDEDMDGDQGDAEAADLEEAETVMDVSCVSVSRKRSDLNAGDSSQGPGSRTHGGR